MIVPMAKIRVLGPSSRLSAVVALFQEIGAIHIESFSPLRRKGRTTRGSATSSRIPPERIRSRPSTFAWTPFRRAPRPSSAT
jgi:hypothetical protein